MNKDLQMRADNEYIRYIRNKLWFTNKPIRMNSYARDTLMYHWIALKIAVKDIINLLKQDIKDLWKR